MRLWQLLERKFAKSIVMFHGTSSVFLDSILKNGLTATPAKKHWDSSNRQITVDRPSLESLPGVYMTADIMTSFGHASRTVGKFGGNKLIVIMKITPQSNVADEDYVSKVFHRARKRFGVGSLDDVALFHRNKRSQKYHFRKIIPELHSMLTNNPNMPIDEKLWFEFLAAVVNREYAHRSQRDIDYFLKWRGEILPPQPTIPASEEQYRLALDKITRRYTQSALDMKPSYGDFYLDHSARNLNDIGYRGNNRIIAIVEMISDEYDRTQKALVKYGTPPPDVMQFLESSNITIRQTTPFFV